METWVTEALKQASLATILLVIIYFMFKQQERRDAAGAQEMKEMRDSFVRTNEKLSDQISAIVRQLTLITSNMTSAIEQGKAAHDAQARAHDHQKDEHKEILRELKLLQGGHGR